MKRLICFVLFLAILGGGLLFVACQRTAAPGSTSGIATPVGQYPVNAPGMSLRYWLALAGNINPNFTNYADTPFGEELLKQIGITVEFLHPPTASVAEAFNLMIAAGDDMPDIVEYNWVTLAGGPQRYIDDGIVLELSDVISRYAPNLRRYLDANPDYDRMVKTDEGNYYNFPFVRGHEELLYSQGLMIRKDWLDELGLQPPQTMDDWYNMLVAFRNRGVAAPFTNTWGNRNRMFMPGFGFLNGMYISHETGRMAFGQINPNYRRWVETMARWYS